MKSSGLSWRIVLVRPRNPLNIGAAARAMTNFGFQKLVVVAAHPPVWEEARSAVGAEHVIKSAQTVSSLQDAIGETSLVVGTTSGSRRNLDRELVPLAELPAWLKAHAAGRSRAAILFGSEKTGLSNEELSYCHALVRIPTSPRCSSMNLGQAVAVCCYELARAGVVSRRRPAATVHLSEPADVHSLEHLFERAVRVLDHSGYLKPKARQATLIKLRRVLLDLALTDNDVRSLGGILAQIEWKLEMPKAEVGSQKSEG